MDERKRHLLQSEAESLKQRDRSPVNFWNPKPGVKSTIRILPGKDYLVNPESVFFKKIKVHWGVGPEKKRVTCRQTLQSQSEPVYCPVCEYAASLMNSTRKEDVVLGKEMMAQDRYVMNIIDISEPEKGVQVFECGRGLFNDILQLFLDEEYGDLDDLNTGRNIKIERVGTTKFDTRYSVMPAAQQSRVNPRVMEKAYDLDAIYQVPAVSELVAILEGKAESEQFFDEVDTGDFTPVPVDENISGGREVKPEKVLTPLIPQGAKPAPSAEVEDIDIPFDSNDNVPAKPVSRESYLSSLRKEIQGKK